MLLDTVRCWVDEVLVEKLDAKKRHTLASVAAGIIESRSVVLGEIGRGIPSEAYDKHKIKQVDRFLGNAWFDVKSVSEGLMQAFGFVKHQRVLLTHDWTTLGRFEEMTASVVAGGRALPFHWTTVNKKRGRLAAAQRWHVDELMTLLPPDVEFISLFDAGFDDVSFVEHLLAREVRFVVRSSPQVCIRPKGQDEWIHLRQFPMERGKVYDFGEVEFTKEHRLPLRFIAVHDHGQKRPWLLLTNLQGDAQQIVTYYGRRFETEETYKDRKDVRAGMQLKGTRVTDPLRLTRLAAAQSVAYLLMVCAGIYGEDLGLHRQMQTNTVRHKRVLALWRVGRSLIRKGKVRRQHLLGRLSSLLDTLSISFGGRPCPASG